MTSTLGATALRDEKAVGIGAKTVQHDHTAMENASVKSWRMRSVLSWLNRIDEIIVFHKLTKPELRQIVQLMTKTLRRVLRNSISNCNFRCDRPNRQEGFDPEYGARPTRRAIRGKRKSKTHLVKNSSAEKFASVKKVTIGSQKEKWRLKKQKSLLKRSQEA